MVYPTESLLAAGRLHRGPQRTEDMHDLAFGRGLENLADHIRIGEIRRRTLNLAQSETGGHIGNQFAENVGIELTSHDGHDQVVAPRLAGLLKNMSAHQPRRAEYD